MIYFRSLWFILDHYGVRLIPLFSIAAKRDVNSTGRQRTLTQIGVPYLDQGTYPEISIEGVWSFFLGMLVVKPSNVCREKSTQ